MTDKYHVETGDIVDVFSFGRQRWGLVVGTTQVAFWVVYTDYMHIARNSHAIGKREHCWHKPHEFNIPDWVHVAIAKWRMSEC